MREHSPCFPLFIIRTFTICTPHNSLTEEEQLAADAEEDDEEAIERRRLAMEEKRKRKMYERAVKILNPETIAAQYLKPEDQAIKEKDFPERYQLAGIDSAEVIRSDMSDMSDST